MVNIHVDATWFRFGLRAYFVIAILFCALVGDFCCHLQTKLRLLKGHPSPVHGMTGWLKGFSSWLAAIRLRRLPGGWLGAVMLFTALLAIGADFGTAFVTWVSLPSRCEFGTGLVMNVTAAHYYPSYYDAAYQWASSAQIYSMENGGLMGIYAKADNSTIFRADSDDWIGGWVCDTSANTVDYTGYTDEEIWLDLYAKDLLYFNASYSNVTHEDTTGNGLTPQGRSTQLFIMSVENEQVGTVFDMKMAVDLEDGPQDDLEDDQRHNTKTMQTYHCQVKWRNDTEGQWVPDIVAQIAVYDIWNTWVQGFRGSLYAGLGEMQSVAYPHIVLEWILNSMVMVSGSAESVAGTAPPGSTEGCVYYGTYLPPGVLFLIVLTAFVAAALTTYAVFLWFYVRIARDNYDRNNPNSNISAEDICDGAPNGLLDWMSHSAYASNHNVNRKPAYRRLSSWHLSTKHHGGRRMGVVENGQQVQQVEHASPALAFSPMTPMTNTTVASPPLMHQQEYFDQKTGYSAVHNQEMPRY